MSRPNYINYPNHGGKRSPVSPGFPSSPDVPGRSPPPVPSGSPASMDRTIFAPTVAPKSGKPRVDNEDYLRPRSTPMDSEDYLRPRSTPITPDYPSSPGFPEQVPPPVPYGSPTDIDDTILSPMDPREYARKPPVDTGDYLQPNSTPKETYRKFSTDNVQHSPLSPESTYKTAPSTPKRTPETARRLGTPEVTRRPSAPTYNRQGSDNSPALPRLPPPSRKIYDEKPDGEDVALPTPVPSKKERQEMKKQKKKRKKKGKKNASPYYYQAMQYKVEDVPPWYLLIFLGFQHYLIMFGATVANPLVVTDAMCVGNDDVAKAEIIGTIFVVSGICTFLQCTFGVRLPIVQGGTFTFVTPILAILSLDKWKCPNAGVVDPCAAKSTSTLSPMEEVTTITPNLTETGAFADASGAPLWHSRIREIQGAIIIASLFQIAIGFSGVMGMTLRFIGPLAIAPTIALAGLALFDVAAYKASQQWWITLATVVLIVAFSQYSKNIKVPCFTFKRGEGCKSEPLPIFRLFPVILAILLIWAICAILSAAGVFSTIGNMNKQTTLNTGVFIKAPWFRMPYPGQWGMPTVSFEAVFGMLAGVLASMVESVGDYYACARMARVPPPPMHAVNRGIGVEGIGCVIAGLFGSGSGTTSYSENIGAIGITKVGSRAVFQMAALFMVLFGIFAKLGAIFTSIPDPIVGGVFIVMFGMVTAVGISNLQFVDLNSSRNLFIIGFCFFFGLTLPGYLKANPKAIQTGNEVMNQIFTVLLSTSMFVGGLAGFILDNTIPGTDEERGLLKWREQILDLPYDTVTGADAQAARAKEDQVYEIPSWTKFLKRCRCTRYLPFLPTFRLRSLNRCRRLKPETDDSDEENQETRNNADQSTSMV